MSKLKITQTKSVISEKQNQQNRGYVNTVRHLVKVEEIQND